MLAFLLAAATLVCVPPSHAADEAPGAANAIVKELAKRKLEGMNGKEVLMLTVQYAPGGASLPHRHNAQVFVYVLEGTLRMQVKGGPPVVLGPGETFYEGPEDVHTVSANASKDQPARILVFMIKDVGAPVSVAAPTEAPAPAEARP